MDKCVVRSISNPSHTTTESVILASRGVKSSHRLGRNRPRQTSRSLNNSRFHGPRLAGAFVYFRLEHERQAKHRKSSTGGTDRKARETVRNVSSSERRVSENFTGRVRISIILEIMVFSPLARTDRAPSRDIVEC